MHIRSIWSLTYIDNNMALNCCIKEAAELFGFAEKKKPSVAVSKDSLASKRSILTSSSAGKQSSGLKAGAVNNLSTSRGLRFVKTVSFCC